MANAAQSEPRWRNRDLLIGALACWAGFVLVLIAVNAGWLDGFDSAGLSAFRNRDGTLIGPPALLTAICAVTAFGGVALRNVIVLAALGTLAFNRERAREIWLTATVIGGWGVDSLVKGVIARSRPALVPHLVSADGYSFPSGHSFNSAVVYLGMALVLSGMLSRPGHRRILVASALALSIAVGITRVMLGVHYPSDVIAGWLGGTGWVLLIASRHRTA